MTGISGDGVHVNGGQALIVTAPAWPQRTACAASVIVMLIGGLGLGGALADLPRLRSFVPGWPLMAGSTALCLMLGGLSILLLRAAARTTGPQASRWRLAIGICGGGMLAIAGIRLVSAACGWSFDLDGLHPASADPAMVMARMSVPTAVNLVVLGSAVLLPDRRALIVVFQCLVIAGSLVGWQGVSRYLYGGEPLFLLRGMSVNTAVAFIAMSAGLLCSRPGGLMELLCSGSEGGVLLRKLLPYAIPLPIILGWFRLQGERAGWYGTEAGLTLFALANVTVFGGLLWASARRLHLLDAERRRHEALATHLAAVVRSSDDSIISKTLDGIITSWNNGAQRLFGYTAEEAVGKPMMMLITPERKAEETTNLRTIAAGRTIEHFETVRVGKDGQVIDVSITVSPISDPAGTIIGASSIARDISGRKRSEKRLRSQLARLDLLRQVTRAISEHQDLPSIYQVVVRCLEEQMPIDFACVCLYDRSTHSLVVSRVGVNSAALAMELALTEQAVIPIDRNGLSRCVLGELVYEPDISDVDFPFPRRLAAAGLRSFVAAPLEVESHVVGAILACRRQAQAFTSGECEFLHQLSAHVALATRHAELYTALQRAYDDLRQTQQAVMQHERLRAVGQMASGIAHDINNSLSPVVMYAEQLLAKETQLGERARNALRTILRASEDVTNTVGRLREFYRQQDQREQMTGMDLNQIIQHVIDLTRARWGDVAQQRGITITVDSDLAPDLPFALGVESEIREALTNLMLNAIDAMPGGGAITLRTQLIATEQKQDGIPGGRLIRLEVADTGSGMNEQTRLRCLEPFFTTKGERGTGLGLAMVYGTVQRHGADLSIDSVVGKGSVFRLDFHNLSSTQTPTAQDVAGLPLMLRLLLVDDDPIILKALSDTLSDEGHELVMASGGQAGIDAFHAAMDCGQPFHAVITDLGMPRVDGRRVATAIKERSPATPVIMLTGWGQRMADNGELPAHVDRMLSKPPRIREIRNALMQLVTRL